MGWIAKCWKCGTWIRDGDDYDQEEGFYTCADCQDGDG